MNVLINLIFIYKLQVTTSTYLHNKANIGNNRRKLLKSVRTPADAMAMGAIKKLVYLIFTGRKII